MSVQLAMLDPVVMAGQETKPGTPDQSGDPQSGGAHPAAPNVLFLSLDDLVPDDTSSIVIMTGGDNLIVKLASSEEVVDRGIAESGSRSELFDVSGMDYCQFSSGTKLYYTQEDVRLILSED